MDVLPWIEKYRPKKLDNVLSHTEIVSSMKNFISTSSLPHILFYGPPGTGKTTVIMACIREMYGKDADVMVLDLNASEERGIDIVKIKIKKFVKSQNVFAENLKHNFKIVVLDEIDSMTDDAQSILRKIIEENTKNARFCLLCNYINKIHIELRSRCICFKFKPLEENQIKNKIHYIIDNENLKVEENATDTLIKRSHGDMRKILNILQTTSMISNIITSDSINNCIGYPTDKQINLIINELLYNKNNLEVSNKIKDFINENSLSLSDILEEIHNYFYTHLDDYGEELLIDMFLKLKFININLSYNTNLKIDIITLVYAFTKIKENIKQ